MEAVVILPAYNGAETIEQQMESLYRQTWPIRVIIRDDCSTDNTVQIVDDFIRSHHLNSWTLIRNEENAGWKRNFFEGMRTCGGDVIFPCDQDDYWHPDKVEKMMKTMEQQKEIMLLSCDLNIVYRGNAIRAKVYHQNKEEREQLVTKYQFTDQFFRNPRPGCSYAVRRDFFDSVQELWQDNYLYDEFLWLMAAMQDGAYFYNDQLIDYIRSESSVSDIRYKDIEMQKQNLRYIQDTLQGMKRFAEEYPEKVPNVYRGKITAALQWVQRRKKLMETRNPLLWLAMFRDWKYYNSKKNCLSDLYLVLFGSFKRKTI